MMYNCHWHPVKIIVLLQTAVTSGLAAILLVLVNTNVAMSSIAGGLASIVPTIMFAMILFRYPDTAAAKKILNGLYLGEFCKIIIAIIMFSIIFMALPIHPMYFFITYIIVNMSFWLALIIRI